MVFISYVEYKHTRFHYWNPIEEEFQSIDINNLYRSDYPNREYPVPPPTTIYTLIKLRTAFILFWIAFLLYGLLLALIKHYINEDFKSASKWEKLQHILESLSLPEAYGDWDTDNDLCIDGHLKKWKKVLTEMLVMSLLQFITNICLLTPLFITGMGDFICKNYTNNICY